MDFREIKMWAVLQFLEFMVKLNFYDFFAMYILRAVNISIAL